MANQKQQDAGKDRDTAGRQADTPAPAPETEADGAEALNDARALQQMIEGTPDSTDEFRRIEQKQKR
jgi:hypothetical protein